MGRMSLIEPHLRDGRLVAPFAERMPTGDALTLDDERRSRRAFGRFRGNDIERSLLAA
jgi:hypothetical protein